MKITKGLAERVAIRMTNNLEEKQLELRKQLSEILYGWVIAKVSKSVLNVFYSNDKSYFKTSNEVRLHGHGFNCDTKYLNEYFPSNGYESRNINLNEEMALQIRPLINQIEYYKKEINSKRDLIENAIITLGTMKRVSEQFPEALPFFPTVKPKESVMVNLTDVREFAKGLAK